MSVEMVTEAEDFEAQARRRMATVTRARGWDSQRDRDDDLAEVDDLLDQYNAAVRSGR